MYAFYSNVAALGIEKIACCNCGREREIFSFVGRGFSVSELAIELHVSVKTIETHQMRIKEKLALRSAAELRQKAREWLARSALNRIREDPESD
jgi:DNA-binding CsgD family transcriptional regulator